MILRRTTRHILTRIEKVALMLTVKFLKIYHKLKKNVLLEQ